MNFKCCFINEKITYHYALKKTFLAYYAYFIILTKNFKNLFLPKHDIENSNHNFWNFSYCFWQKLQNILFQLLSGGISQKIKIVAAIFDIMLKILISNSKIEIRIPCHQITWFSIRIPCPQEFHVQNSMSHDLKNSSSNNKYNLF